MLNIISRGIDRAGAFAFAMSGVVSVGTLYFGVPALCPVTLFVLSAILFIKSR